MPTNKPKSSAPPPETEARDLAAALARATSERELAEAELSAAKTVLANILGNRYTPAVCRAFEATARARVEWCFEAFEQALKLEATLQRASSERARAPQGAREREAAPRPKTKRRHRPQRKGWINLADAADKYRVPYSTLQGFKVDSKDREKEEGLVFLRVSALEELLKAKGLHGR